MTRLIKSNETLLLIESSKGSVPIPVEKEKAYSPEQSVKAHQRCTVHKLRNLVAKAPKHAHEAVREDYHRIVYAETLEMAKKAREAFLRKWEKQSAGVAASLEEAGEKLLTFFQFPESQWVSLRTTNVIERMQLEFRRRVKTQAALPNEGAVLRVFFGLWVSGQMKLRRIRGYGDIKGTEKAAA